jgi:acyl-CoA thioester hydrolase
VYFEVARVESLRALGIAYKDMEDRGVLLPVLDYSIRFFKPALYDDLLEIHTVIPELPAARIRFEYETYNQRKELLNRAATALVFIRQDTKKPCPAPDDFLERIMPYFS